jgi:hypothetical protein
LSGVNAAKLDHCEFGSLRKLVRRSANVPLVRGCAERELAAHVGRDAAVDGHRRRKVGVVHVREVEIEHRNAIGVVLILGRFGVTHLRDDRVFEQLCGRVGQIGAAREPNPAGRIGVVVVGADVLRPRHLEVVAFLRAVGEQALERAHVRVEDEDAGRIVEAALRAGLLLRDVHPDRPAWRDPCAPFPVVDIDPEQRRVVGRPAVAGLWRLDHGARSWLESSL